MGLSLFYDIYRTLTQFSGLESFSLMFILFVGTYPEDRVVNTG